MIQVASVNIQTKIKIICLLSESFTFIQVFHQVCPLSMLLCIIVAEVLVIFIDSNKRIKDIQMGDHKIKIVNFADVTTIFLRDFSCLTKIEFILELFQKAFSSKINFSKSHNLWGVEMTNGLVTILRQNRWSTFS